jgi:predicted nucleotidyltransferase
MNAITTDTRVLDAVAAHPYPLVFATISGAHLYGFDSPDSDVDIRGAHILPVEEVLGLDPAAETTERRYFERGLDVDLVTHDIRKFASLLLKRNGYVLEQLLSPLVVASTPTFDELRALAPGLVTRHHAHHYIGFAATQWALFEKENPRRAKPLLYVYRVLLTGLHLMRTGEVEANLARLLEERTDLGDVRDMLGRKRTGAEQLTVDDAELDVHASRYERLAAELVQAAADTALPDKPSGRPELDALIIRARLGSGARVATR